MSSAEQRLSELDYLALERRASSRSEFFRGRMYAMAGASRAHNLITLNVGSELRSQLRGRPCETYVNDMRVKVDATGLYTYPDVLVVCGEPRFEDAAGDTLLNPQVIIEVLSASTEAYDRSEKFDHYGRLDSLSDYVLISQDRCRVEHYERKGPEQWLLSVSTNPRGELSLQSIDCRVRVAEIYSRVTLDPSNDLRSTKTPDVLPPE
jgi:Uma2 family endonuclease